MAELGQPVLSAAFAKIAAKKAAKAVQTDIAEALTESLVLTETPIEVEEAPTKPKRSTKKVVD